MRCTLATSSKIDPLTIGDHISDGIKNLWLFAYPGSNLKLSLNKMNAEFDSDPSCLLTCRAPTNRAEGDDTTLLKCR